jgi:hypothetical protein
MKCTDLHEGSLLPLQNMTARAVVNIYCLTVTSKQYNMDSERVREVGSWDLLPLPPPVTPNGARSITAGERRTESPYL